MVSTLDSESSDPSSNLGRTLLFFSIGNLHANKDGIASAIQRP